MQTNKHTARATELRQTDESREHGEERAGDGGQVTEVHPHINTERFGNKPPGGRRGERRGVTGLQNERRGPGVMQQRGWSEPRFSRLLQSPPQHHHCTEVMETCSTFLSFTPRCVVEGKKGRK
ncbi:hypothetical protein EYF80_038874 [Liparis tanakae]|uniref:Uncharacterized protein n=1 Tax=Liparis tanakae TaxID=230148 RepID=A0A4Z2GCH5_9TELE|nr:hypothetical protein EYF80_038874 [Liparis tanakae]